MNEYAKVRMWIVNRYVEKRRLEDEIKMAESWLADFDKKELKKKISKQTYQKKFKP